MLGSGAEPTRSRDWYRQAPEARLIPIMTRHPASFNLLSSLAPLVVALSLSSCGSTTVTDTEIDPSRSGDPNSIHTLMAKFARAVHEVADLNENGEATIGELTRVSKTVNEAKFATYDEDDSGGISIAESIKAIEEGPVSGKLRSRFDPNGDGRVEPADMARFDELIGDTDGLRNFIQVEQVFSL